jgi:hypothetical protein
MARTYRLDELAWLRAALVGTVVAVVVEVAARGALAWGWTLLVAVGAGLLYDWFLERLVLGPDALVRRAMGRRVVLPLGEIARIELTGRIGEDPDDPDTLVLSATLRDNTRVRLARLGGTTPYALLGDLREAGVHLGHEARTLLDGPRWHGRHRHPEQARRIGLFGLVVLAGMAGTMVGYLASFA